MAPWNSRESPAWLVTGTECRTRDRGVRIAEIRVIHDVVTLEAEFEIDPLFHFEMLNQRQVPIGLPVAADSGERFREGTDITG